MTISAESIAARRKEAETAREFHIAQAHIAMGIMSDCDYWLDKLKGDEPKPDSAPASGTEPNAA